jgi:ribose transport system substrate-binding protein
MKASKFLTIIGTTVPLCLAAPAMAKDLVIGYASNAMSFTYNAAIAAGFQEAAKAAGVKVILLDNKGNIEKQGNDVDDLIAQKVDGIALMPGDAAAAQTWVDRASKAGIPTVSMGAQVGDPKKRDGKPVYEKLTALVVPHEVNAGAAAGEFAATILPKDKTAKIAVIEGAAGFIEVINRRDGLEQGLKKAGAKYNVVAAQPGDWRQEKAEAACQNILVAHPDIDLFFTQSDEMVMGCARSVKAVGSKAKLVSMGGTKLAIDAIKAGTIDASVCYKPQDTGRLGFKALHAAMQNKGAPPKAEFINYATPAVTKNNLSACEPQW